MRGKIVFFEVDRYEQEIFQEKLAGSGELIFYPHRLTHDNVDEAKSADYLVSFIYSDFSEKILDQLPQLKGIATMSVGTDHISLVEATRRDIPVANVPAYGPNTVAEHAAALMLAMSRRIVDSVDRTREGVYEYTGLTGWDLKGKTLGIIGTGKIGAHLARIANGFQMRLVAYDPMPNEKLSEEFGIEYLSMPQLLHTADVISLHVPLTKETQHMIAREQFEQMKPGIVVINTARGGLIDPDALLEALESGKVSQAGIDVLEDEGLLKEEKEFFSKYFKLADYQTALANHALMRHPKVIVTPHNAFNSKEALQNIIQTTVDNIKSMLDGEPHNLVNHIK